MDQKIKSKAAIVAQDVTAATKDILAAMERLDSDAVGHLTASGVLDDPYVVVFLFFYYRACGFLARCVHEPEPVFGDNESPEAQDVAQYACIFSAAKDLEMACGGGPEFYNAMRGMMDNEDLLLLFLASYVYYVEPARPPRKVDEPNR